MTRKRFFYKKQLFFGMGKEEEYAQKNVRGYGSIMMGSVRRWRRFWGEKKDYSLNNLEAAEDWMWITKCQVTSLISLTSLQPFKILFFIYMHETNQNMYLSKSTAVCHVLFSGSIHLFLSISLISQFCLLDSRITFLLSVFLFSITFFFHYYSSSLLANTFLPLNYLERRPTFILLAKFDLLVMGSSSSAFHSHFGLTRLQIYPIIQYIRVILITYC